MGSNIIRKKRDRPEKVWREIDYTVEIPEGISVEVVGNNIVTVKGEKGEITRQLRYPRITIHTQENQVLMSTKYFSKSLKTIMGTYRAHINNMIKGVSEGFEYNLKVVYSKFPMTVEKKEDTLLVKNLLGEKVPRIVKIPKGAQVDVKGEDITVTGIDKEVCGKAAALIEQSTRITHMDRRVIQDGIYITQKPHRVYS
ncbi:MAG: 50S ribosomal protein L6 [Candidatus Nanoarchaeia archaeon]